MQRILLFFQVHVLEKRQDVLHLPRPPTAAALPSAVCEVDASEGRKEGRKEGMKEGRKEGRNLQYPSPHSNACR